MAASASMPFTPSTREPVNKWLVTVSITFGTLMGTIDASIVNVAIPHMRGTVGATVEEITWISTGFIIANVVVMPLTAFLGRLFGQKRVYLSCLVLFIVGSALCGTARSLTTLVAFRVIQGFGAGALQPTEQAILRQTFPPAEQGMAMALFGMAVMIGPALGPTLGGYIVDNYSWPWIFYINVPVGILATVMVSRFVHEPDDIRHANQLAAEKQRKHMDWAGIALLSIGLCALQYALEEGQRNDWFESPLIRGCFIVSALALAFVSARADGDRPRRRPPALQGPGLPVRHPHRQRACSRCSSRSRSCSRSSCRRCSASRRRSPGSRSCPRTLVMMVVTPMVGKFYNKVSPRLVVGIGVVFFAIGAYQMSHYTLDTSSSGIVLGPPRPGDRLQLPLRPADDRLALDHLPAQAGGRGRDQARSCVRSAARSASPSSRPS